MRFLGPLGSSGYVVYFFASSTTPSGKVLGLRSSIVNGPADSPWDPRWQSQLTLWSVRFGDSSTAVSRDRSVSVPAVLAAPSSSCTGNVCGHCERGTLAVLVLRVAAYRRGTRAWPYAVYCPHLLCLFGGIHSHRRFVLGLAARHAYNVQYIVFVWHFNRRRFASESTPKPRAVGGCRSRVGSGLRCMDFHRLLFAPAALLSTAAVW